MRVRLPDDLDVHPAAAGPHLLHHRFQSGDIAAVDVRPLGAVSLRHLANGCVEHAAHRVLAVFLPQGLDERNECARLDLAALQVGDRDILGVGHGCTKKMMTSTLDGIPPSFPANQYFSTFDIGFLCHEDERSLWRMSCDEL